MSLIDFKLFCFNLSIQISWSLNKISRKSRGSKIANSGKSRSSPFKYGQSCRNIVKILTVFFYKLLLFIGSKSRLNRDWNIIVALKLFNINYGKTLSAVCHTVKNLIDKSQYHAHHLCKKRHLYITYYMYNFLNHMLNITQGTVKVMSAEDFFVSP